MFLRQRGVPRLQELKEIASFARLLQVQEVGLHIGFVPHATDDAAYRNVVAAARAACDHCAANGQSLHLETGQEPADVLLRFLRDVERDNLFVNFDPANMILYGVGEPLPALEKLAPTFIVSTAKMRNGRIGPGKLGGRKYHWATATWISLPTCDYSIGWGTVDRSRSSAKSPRSPRDRRVRLAAPFNYSHD